MVTGLISTCSLPPMGLIGRVADKIIPLILFIYIGWGYYLVTFEIGCARSVSLFSNL
ncbi:uncharacterized protein EI90DRAFT_3068168, partial [Cantharellus anzutake]|uniref:uncharacterized protein n=1 Tax=Cantharellus anzutake TaxID=1750568 RepID=UPI001904D272